MTIATATEVQNKFGRFLQTVMDGTDVIILKNGKEAARLVSANRTASFLTDSLTGILSADVDEKAMRSERIETHEGID